jgi:hypothetical protein
MNKIYTCILPLYIKTHPIGYTVELKESVILEGYLMGKTPVLKTPKGSFIISEEDLIKHFKAER